MSKCAPREIVSAKHFNISMCPSCKRIGLYYKNILSGFAQEEFCEFAEGVINTSFDQYAVNFPPNGDKRIVLKTCHQDIQFSFNNLEFEELQQALQEAILLIEAEKVLEQTS